jgi:beta-glucanase (GH16 family)
VPSEIRTGKQALRVGSSASQRLLLGKLEPGKSYSLVIKAKTLQAGAGEVAVVFREPAYDSTFRTYKAAVSSTAYTDVRIDFTVPAYSGVVDLVLKANGVPFIVDSASLTAREPIALTEAVTDTTHAYVLPGYVLAFNDEFNGTELDRKKWFTRYMYAGETQDHLGDELQRYRDNNNHVLENGILKLTARKVGPDDQAGSYESGMIRSDWATHYGYYEARVKMPGGRGVWPAFWLDASVRAGDGLMSWPPEIDIFEYVVNDTSSLRNMIFHNVHINANAPGGNTSTVMSAHPDWNEQWRYWTAPYNFNDGWHTIGAEWTPTKVTTYIDGVKIVERTISWDTIGGLAGPAHILLNLGIGGSWPGFDIDDTVFPQALQIDWVRAYKKVN